MIPERFASDGQIPVIQPGLESPYDREPGWTFIMAHAPHFLQAQTSILSWLREDQDWQAVAFRKYQDGEQTQAFKFVLYSDNPPVRKSGWMYPQNEFLIDQVLKPEILTRRASITGMSDLDFGYVNPEPRQVGLYSPEAMLGESRQSVRWIYLHKFELYKRKQGKIDKIVDDLHRVEVGVGLRNIVTELEQERGKIQAETDEAAVKMEQLIQQITALQNKDFVLQEKIHQAQQLKDLY